MTIGLTSSSTDGDATVQSHLCTTHGIDPPPDAAEEGAIAAVSNNYPSADSGVDSSAASKSDSWRDEVAARLERYRTRRKPRSPRYPSLLLPFDAHESRSRPAPPNGSITNGSATTESATTGSATMGSAGTGSLAVASRLERDEQSFSFRTQVEASAASSYPEPRRVTLVAPQESSSPYPERDLQQSAKVIEFPRSAAIPVVRASELADPIFDRPRIVEAPEILPPPPALGGMTIEPAPKVLADRRAGVDFPAPFSSASIAQRTLAALVDGVVLASALAAFAAIFLRLNLDLNAGLRVALDAGLNAGLKSDRGWLPMLAGTLAAIALGLWAAYDFLFVVYTGSTPGMRAARLRLAAFDGSPLQRSSRRWRVLASFLSLFSAGLGYLWCLLDQHGLCWHDRITRTYVLSAVQSAVLSGVQSKDRPA